MKNFIYILLVVFSVLCLPANAQTPYDSFAPETSRPMLELPEPEPSPDTLFCAIVADLSNQTLLLVDVSTREVLATSPITDDISKWLSVDPLSDKYPNISPYAYCNWNSIRNVDPNGKWVETAWDIANVALDVASLKSNISNGNIGGAVVDGIGLVLDAGATIFPVPGGAGMALKAYRAADRTSDAGKLGKAIDKVITATKSTYRKALQQATGKLGKGYEAHHTLPQKYRKRFEDLGINIDEPGNVVWRKSEGHRAKSAEHTKAWDEFFRKNEAPTKEQVMKYRNEVENNVWHNQCDLE